MKPIKLTLAPILIGMTLLGPISKVYGDTKDQVKTDANIAFIDGTTTPSTPTSNQLLPLGEETIPSFICAGLLLLVLVALILYIRKKGTLRYEKK